MARYHDDPVVDRPAQNNHKKLLTVALAIFCLSFGGTYAANISLNTGGGSEFGQGIVATTGCDAYIEISPATTFANSSSASSSAYAIETLTVSDIAASCAGKSLKVNLYDTVTSTSLTASPIVISFVASPTNGQTFNGSTWSSGSADLKVSGATLSGATINTTTNGADSRAGKTSLILTKIYSTGTTKVAATGIGRVVMESVTYIPIYVIGDTGPGGGTIFLTPSTPGNPSGNYFEFAPADVESNVSWGTGCTGVTGKVNTIGTGVRNTADIVAKCTGGGAISADNYVNNGVSDWFLGSGYEMNAVCMYARGIIATKNPSTEACNTGTLAGGWSNEYTSSSTRGYDGYTMRVVFTGYGLDFNYAPGAVRPIRMFKSGA